MTPGERSILAPGRPERLAYPIVEEAMTTPTQLIDLRTIVSRTGMSRMTIYRRMAAGEFPKPMKLGERINRWREADLEAWITAREVLHAAA